MLNKLSINLNFENLKIWAFYIILMIICSVFVFSRTSIFIESIFIYLMVEFLHTKYSLQRTSCKEELKD